ncbi:bifunctional metallophosphatase/5'-nucleotidase [Pengzhenrongella sp.]|jgi:2',3'-cyclic-nucleotide 2'-phosphodiesterase/3'-nucleotidase|uniref:bifunctional metallophosphatase/5'-nucleotidase n=1 Tax=Pengzhenrongella sp. TaxID=2888820 RepID=UPI002F94DE24
MTQRTPDDATRPTPEGPSRRTVLTGSMVGILASAGFTAGPAAAREGGAAGQGGISRLTVLGTTDLHGNLFNWDYFKDAEYDDAAHNDVGLAKVATLVTAVRHERGRHRTLMIDAGDTLQGTPLAYYYAKIEPIGRGTVHPMAAAMNRIEYDAAALGNHEFNYGLDLLRTFGKQLRFPLLGANAIDDETGRPAFAPYLLKRVDLGRRRPVVVGILGLTNPGIAIWDRDNVAGKLSFPGLVEQAAVWVPRMRAAGADVVVVAAHSGADTSSSYGDALPWPENASTLVAAQVPGIDAILVGHAHVEIAERFVTNEQTGRQVLLTEPLKWGMRLSVIDLDLAWRGGRWSVQAAHAQVLNANTVPEDAAVAGLLRADHEKVRAYVNGVIGSCTQAMSAATARFEDSAALDFINLVQARTVRAGLVGTASADLPVLSIAAPFNPDAAIPAGSVSVRDVAGLYIYDNTLLGVTMTGAGVKEYLEKSAQFFKAQTTAGPFAASEVCNAVTPTAPNGTPDYNYDVMSGLDARLEYDIDLAKPVGSRILGLSYGGAPIEAAASFVVAINNYRASGGGAFPHTKDAPVVYNRQLEIRQLLIDWVTAQGSVDPTAFFTVDWQLVVNGAPVVVTGGVSPGRH